MNDKLLQRIYGFITNPKYLFLGCGLSFCIIIMLFGFNRTKFDFDDRIDNETFGTIGDFFGGVIGTFFALVSVFWMAKAFEQQSNEAHEARKQVRQNHKQLSIQRFHEMFFELLHLYQTIVSNLSVTEHIEIIGQDNAGNPKKKTYDNSYDNKDFFDKHKALLQADFSPANSFKQNRYNATRKYLEFYALHKHLGAYYRTLYRIFDLINERATDKSFNAVEYVKIIRAQLTESELFFLRYNGNTLYGRQFVPLLNKYNVLKHLPILELLEFKYWASKLPTVLEQTYINILLRQMYKTILELLKGIKSETPSEKWVKSPLNKSLRYNIHYTATSMELTIDIVRKLSSSGCQEVYKPLDRFSNLEIQQLLDCFLKEIFVFSKMENFWTSDFKLISPPIITDREGCTHISSQIISRNGKNLLSHILPYNPAS